MAKHKVRILFEPERANPPVYVCGTFTTPPWIPVLMQEFLYGPEDHRRYAFVHEMEVEEGRWEYKIRIGESDWICDETAPKVLNDQGTMNNLLVVEPPDHSKSMVSAVNPFVPSSGRSISWELVKKDSVETEGRSHGNSFQSAPDGVQKEIFAEPAEISNDLEAPPPIVIDCHVAQAGVSRSPRSINIRKRNSSAGAPHLGGGSSEMSLGDGQIFDAGCNNAKHDMLPREMQRSQSVADIDRVRYIMAMPREDGSSEPPSIMAYQGSQIMQLTPDFTSAVPLAADGACNIHGPQFVSHSRFSSDVTASTAPRAESFESSQHSERQSDVEGRSWPVRRDSLNHERDLQELQRQHTTQMIAAYWNHRAKCMCTEAEQAHKDTADDSVVGEDSSNDNNNGLGHPTPSESSSDTDRSPEGASHDKEQSTDSHEFAVPCPNCGFDEQAYRRLVMEEVEPVPASSQHDRTCTNSQPAVLHTNMGAVAARPMPAVGDGALSGAASVHTVQEAAGQSILMKIGAWFRSLFACILCRK